MVDERHVDAKLFWVEYAFLDWASLLRPRQRGDAPTGRIPTTHNPDQAVQQVGLRWHVNAAEHTTGTEDPIGLPTGPFTVWRRRPGGTQDLEEPLTARVKGGLFMGMRLVIFDRTVATLTLQVSSPSGGIVIGLANAPKALSALTWDSVPAGSATIRLAAGRMNGLLMPPAMNILGAHGSDPTRVANELDWEPLEIVGMPVDDSWSGIGDHLTEQGFVGALTDPISAAKHRLVRGTPPFGWHNEVEPGVLAPQWLAPDPDGVIDEVRVEMLPQLQKALQLPQPDQVAHRSIHAMPPPETLQGDAMSGSASDAEIPSVAMLQLAVSGDPFLSLALGHGTNIAEGKGTSDFGNFERGPEFDYMVTAPFRPGIGAGPAPIELASLALRARPAFPPALATNIESEQLASLPPPATDTHWRASTITKWDRAFEMALVRTASHAVARHEPGETASKALLEERPSQGHHPITPAVSEGDDQFNFVHYADRELIVPNDPGNRSVRYSVANQNIFSVWSPWQTAGVTVAQPALAPPKILDADFDVVAPATGTVCPATLTVDLTWDWTDRRPQQLRLVGRVFAAADRATAVPIPFPPAGLERAIATPGAAIVLSFAGDTASLSGAPPGSTIRYLDPQGDAEVTSGAAQGDGARRYRVRIAGLVADFTTTDHIGFALWAAGTERIPPNRTVAGATEFYAYSSDPVAPAVPPELVPLSSLPDAEGRSHARISWPAAPGAAAYVVYSSDEITMRAHYDLGEPNLDDTLSDRLTELLDAWVADPDRRPFTRRIAKPVTGRSVDVSLPRGTTGISTFVIVSLSAGQVEGPWPDPTSSSLRDEVIVRATPRIAAPSTPEIEARADGSVVHLMVRTRPGHRVGKLDIHRVRVDAAARELDTMGPPIETVNETTGGWNIETDTDGTPLSFAGTDSPGSSWRRVWYRAVAWADDEWPVSGEPFPEAIAERGLLAGRSPSSNAVSVVVPPPNPPDLSPITVSWPGGSLAHVLLSWTTTAPFTAPLGAHRTEIDIRESAASSPLIAVSDDLENVTTVSPTVGHGVWRDDGSTPARFNALIRRSDVNTEVDAVVQIIDPLGRATHQNVHIGAGSVLPAPVLTDLEMFTIAGRGTILTFNSTSPITRFGSDAYRLHIAATRTTTPTIPPVGRPGRPGLPIPPIRPGPLVRGSRPPVAGATEPSAIRRGSDPELPALVRPRPGTIGDLAVFGRPIVLEVDLPDVPIDRGQPSTSADLQIRRMRGGGPSYTYSVLAKTAVSGFALRLTSPDGRTASVSTKDRES